MGVRGAEKPTSSQFKLATKTLLLASSLLASLGAGCRQDMHDQPKYKPYRASDFFGDRRSSRDPVPGTVARGQLKEDTYLETGKVGDKFGDVFPFPVVLDNPDRKPDLVSVARGRERYEIYCTPCHGRTGLGNGMVVQRGYRRPPSFHIDRLRQAPAGYFFDVMTNGFGAMPDYAAQIPPRDRWCIVAYIRALQLSQNASAADIAGQQIPSAAPAFEEPGSGA